MYLLNMEYKLINIVIQKIFSDGFISTKWLDYKITGIS